MMYVSLMYRLWKILLSNMQGCGLGRDVSVSRQSRDVLTSRLGLEPMCLKSCLSLGAICLGLGPVDHISGLGPLHLVETFCTGPRCAYCSCS